MKYPPFRPTPTVGKNYLVMDIPRDDDWMQSFDTVIPRKIQGRTCKVVKPARPATYHSDSTDNTVEIDGSTFLVPTWALEEIVAPTEQPIMYEI